MKKIIVISLLLSFSLLASQRTFATDLRGYVQYYNSYSGLYYPASGVMIQLYCLSGGQWVPCGTPAYSGYDGLYYFTGLYAGYNYYLGINGQYYPLYVSNPTFQDVPAITL